MDRIKVDENVPDSVALVLNDPGHDVALAREEHLAGAPGDVLLRVASEERPILVTLDPDFTNTLRHTPSGTAGIVALRLADQTVTRVRAAAATSSRSRCFF